MTKLPKNIGSSVVVSTLISASLSECSGDDFELLAPVRIADITVDNLGVASTGASDTVMGFVDVPYPLRGYIINVPLTNDLGGSLKLVGSGLRVAGPLAFGSHSISLTATISRDVRGVGVGAPVMLSKKFVLEVN